VLVIGVEALFLFMGRVVGSSREREEVREREKEKLGSFGRKLRIVIADVYIYIYLLYPTVPKYLRLCLYLYILFLPPRFSLYDSYRP
jgi:hypothetical protein